MPNEPHILLASSNMVRLINNLAGALTPVQIARLRLIVRQQVIVLFHFGEEHYKFAKKLSTKSWRQKVSRYYYGAFNVSRAVRLEVRGEYSTDVSDHRKFENLPDDFPNKNTYVNQLNNLRLDRNLCDYDHTATIDDLLLELPQTEAMVSEFLRDSRAYLLVRGVKV